MIFAIPIEVKVREFLNLIETSRPLNIICIFDYKSIKFFFNN